VNRSICSMVAGLATVLIVAVMLAPAARAQLSLSALPRAAVRAKPIGAQAPNPVRQPFEPDRNQLLIGPGPIFAATTTNLFAQVAFGGGYTTGFTFMNTGADAATGNLILTGNNGAPLAASFSSPGVASAVGSSFAISVPSGGSQLVIADAVNPGDATSTGWARVESTGGSLGGVATFQLTVNNSLQTIVGVLSGAATAVATFPADDDHSLFRDTGYAVANPGNTPINIKVVLVHPDGTIHQTIFPPALNPLPPGGHVATFLWQDLNDSFLLFRGTVVLVEQASIPFSVVALVLNNGLFTAIPVLPTKAPGIQ